MSGSAAGRAAQAYALLRQAEGDGTLPEVLAFYDHAPLADGPGPWVLSQWWAAPFTVAGVVYATAEHWMMAAKAGAFGDDEALARVLGSPSPEVAKQAGRAVRGFDSAAWREVAYDVVVEGSAHKFGAHEDLRAYLLGTGDAVLVEASPVDRVWGVGLPAGDPAHRRPSAWRGEDLLGLALMEVRDRLRG